MEVEYFRLTKKMIRISKKLGKNRILHYLNPEFSNNNKIIKRGSGILLEDLRKMSMSGLS